MDFEEQPTATLEPSTINRIRELERELAQLRDDPDPGISKSPIFQTLHVLDRDSTRYLAEPSWDVRGSQRYLKGNLPLSQPKAHLKRLGNIAFVVYSEYDSRVSTKEYQKDAELKQTTVLPDVKPSSHYVELYSSPMKEAMRAFLTKIKQLNGDFPDSDFPDSDSDEGHSLKSPFLFWYHYRSAGLLEQLTTSQQDLMKLLTDWIDAAYGDTYAKFEALVDRGMITNDTVEFLLHPGQIIVWNRPSVLMGCKVVGWATERGHSLDDVFKSGDETQDVSDYNVRVWYYRYDGRFWKHTENACFKLAASEKQPEIRIDTLSVFPLHYASTDQKVRLERRGHTFWRCRQRQFVSYRARNDDEVLMKDERYMVDFSTYQMLHSDRSNFEREFEDTHAFDYISDEVMSKDRLPFGHETLFPPKITGFSMRKKKWQDLDVDNIQDVKWYKEAFDHLVIGEETKELVQALITNRIESEKSTDWISTKGNGLIMLLHGGPGTGKTFTAESVAELAEKPLYTVTCGDVGTKPENVEKYLESVFHLGKLWDCVVLLDEADVFLEQRTLNDLRRNALVSVFLRVLEYYDGILILTTNRVGIFDEAFKSRIQLALHYENLEKPQRYYIDELAEYPMNGRQIRNTITTARQLAKFKKRPMSFGHLRHVIKVAGKFDQYLLEVHDKISDDQIARGEGIR
ncbi:hypothetical protein PG990_012051 [Apiospora arundinis]